MNSKKKRLPAAERKKQILKCAVKVFAKSNYYTTKMSEIAHEAGISEAMVYRHFPSKKIIFLTILQHISDRILTFWEEEIECTPSAIETLRSMGLEYFHRMIQHPNELKVQFLAISGIEDKDIITQLRNDHKKYINYICTVIQCGIDQGEIRKNVDVEALAVTYNGLGITLNMMRLLALKPNYGEKTVRTILDHFLDSIKE